MKDLERRLFVLEGMKVERREKEAPRIAGHAAVFNTWADIGGMFRERVLPGAFKRAIESQDVRALFNHDPNLILGRNRAQPAPTLTLAEDQKGLAIEILPPDTQWARDLLVSIERGDISQMSFGFRAAKGGQEWNWDLAVPERTLRDVDLYDVSPVTFPAYQETDVTVRSLEEYRREFKPRGMNTSSAAAIVRSKKQILRGRGE